MLYVPSSASSDSATDSVLTILWRRGSDTLNGGRMSSPLLSLDWTLQSFDLSRARTLYESTSIETRSRTVAISPFE